MNRIHREIDWFYRVVKASSPTGCRLTINGPERELCRLEQESEQAHVLARVELLSLQTDKQEKPEKPEPKVSPEKLDPPALFTQSPPHLGAQEAQVPQRLRPTKEKPNRPLKCTIFVDDFLSALNNDGQLAQATLCRSQASAQLGLDPITSIVSHCYGFDNNSNSLQIQLYFEAQFAPRNDTQELENQFITHRQAILYAKDGQQ